LALNVNIWEYGASALPDSLRLDSPTAKIFIAVGPE